MYTKYMYRNLPVFIDLSKDEFSGQRDADDAILSMQNYTGDDDIAEVHADEETAEFVNGAGEVVYVARRVLQ